MYGSARIHAELRMAHGINVSRKRVERLMREAQISGLAQRKRKRTTVRVPGVRVADDLVKRHFRPEALDVLYVADITVGVQGVVMSVSRIRSLCRECCMRGICKFGLGAAQAMRSWKGSSRS